ncbi:MAG: S8 family serine peptidase [Candidatus Thorarchaeota archaeon]
MNHKRTAAVLLFIAAMSLSMFFVPAAPVYTAEPAAAPTLSPQVQEKLEQFYEDVSQPGYVASVNPLLQDWADNGVPNKELVTRGDGAVSVIVVLAPWADEAAITNLVDVDWKVDLTYFKVWKVFVPNVEALNAVRTLAGVAYIDADVMARADRDMLARDGVSVTDSMAPPTVEPDMEFSEQLMGVLDSAWNPALSYDGTGVKVGHIDTGCDFGYPDLQSVYGDAYDPTGWGLVPTIYKANTTVVNVTEWMADPTHLLTYADEDGNIWLNVTGWDPVINWENGLYHLIGDGDDSAPYYHRLGVFTLYLYYWGDNGFRNLLENYVWKDWQLPDPSEIYGNYSVGMVYQRHWWPDYAAGKYRIYDIIAPSLVVNKTGDNDLHVVINWDDTMGWNKLWTAGFRYETLDLTDIYDAYEVLSEFDWNFTDDFYEETYSPSNPVVAHNYTHSYDDFSLGALSWVYDANEIFDEDGALNATFQKVWPQEKMFHMFRSDGEAFALYFDDDTHGTATAGLVAADGSTFHLGVAPGAKIYSVRAITYGSGYGGYLWACGFDYNQTTKEWYYTGNHQVDLLTNSWGWVTEPMSEFDYLGMTWAILSAPDILDPDYDGILHVFSAGNEGAGFMTTGPPGVTDAVLTVGASTSTFWMYMYGYSIYQYFGFIHEGLASFTSKGPAPSGYVKPDVMAPGYWGWAPLPNLNQEMYPLWPGTSYYDDWFGGTSMSAPLVAGVAALVVEALKTNHAGYTSTQVKTIIQQTADDLGYDPSVQGFGRVKMQAAWEYYGALPASFLGAYANNTEYDYPTGIGDASVFFGHLMPGDTATVHQKIYPSIGGTMDDGTGWTSNVYHYAAAEVYTFDGTTFAYNTSFWGEQWSGWFNLRDELGPSVYDAAVSNYKYVTLGVAFNPADIAPGMEPWTFLMDWDDSDPANGIPDHINVTAAVYDGNFTGSELYWMTNAGDDSVTQMLTYATSASSLSADLYGNMTLIIHDPVHDTNMTAIGHNFTCTVIFWEPVASSEISVEAGGNDNSLNFTVTVPNDAEAGIYQGYIELTKGGDTLKLPYSYVVVANLSADIAEVNTVVDGFGDELTPFDAPMFGCGDGDPDDWDFRTFVVYNPHNVSYMGVRAIWGDTGNNMHVAVYDSAGRLLASNDGETATTTAVIATLPLRDTGTTNTTEGYYYLFMHANYVNGTIFTPVNYTIQVMMYEALNASASDVILTYTATDVTEPVEFEDGDTIVGDHATINATYPTFGLANMPELEVTSMSVSLLSGLYFTYEGDLVIPTSGYNPFSGIIHLDEFAWVRVDGIKAGDNVRVVVDFTNGDCDIMAWWADTDNTTWTYDNNLLGDQMATGAKPEVGSFIASKDGSVMFGIFDYDGEEGTFTITVDTRAGETESAKGSTVLFDTYQMLKNGTFQVKVEATTATNIGFVVNLAELTCQNFFAPDISNVQVSKNGNLVNITWDLYDRNAGDDHYFEIAISHDGGLTYQLLAVNVTDMFYVWDSTGFEEGEYKVRVTVFDCDPADPMGIKPFGQGNYWPGLSDTAYSSTFTAGSVPPVTTTPTTTTTAPTTTAPPIQIDPLVIGLLGGIGVGVVVILILFLVKKK